MVMEQRTAAPALPAPRHGGDPWNRVFSDHPFEPVLERAEGVWLYDEDGKRYLDASGGPIAVNLGHGDRRIEASRRQSRCPASRTVIRCFRIIRAPSLAPRVAASHPRIDTVYLGSGGSEAVETAIKIARQYHLAPRCRPEARRDQASRQLSRDVLGALSVAGVPGNRRHSTDARELAHVPAVPRAGTRGRHERPRLGASLRRELEETIHYVGARAGLGFHRDTGWLRVRLRLMAPREYWQAVREICDRYDVLLIADEVVTGFGANRPLVRDAALRRRTRPDHDG